MYTHEARIYYTLLIGAGILAVILSFYTITVIRQHRKRVLSYKDKIITEIIVLEKERGRIAADLHDELSPLLSAIKLYLGCLETLLPQDIELIAKMENCIDISMQKMREISNNLMPILLQHKGLFPAIKELCLSVTSAGSIKVDCQFPEADIQLGKEKEIHIYRIIQEILHNAGKHAFATKMDIRIEIEKKRLSMLLSDNGIGFDEASVTKKSKGLGLYNIIKRVDLLQGSIYLSTQPGQGVSYSIYIPV